MKNICLFGDSLVWGSADYEKGGWGTLLRNNLEEYDRAYVVYNLGISSETTETLLDHFANELHTRKPILTIFGIGINDGCEDQLIGDHRVDPETFMTNLRDLTREAKEVSDAVLFVGLTRVEESQTIPLPWRENLSYRNSHIQLYDEMIAQHCAENDCVYVSLSQVVEESDLVDGLHPNTQGHQKMFEVIKREVLSLLVELEQKELKEEE
ncbi:MAG: Lysophospholipase L1 and related esterase [Candidatus Uhrbacteria bacterium GW2011_GWE2_40_58]|nr:MAG: Lysophospholipase L1 and related esterase [Candidatus Uhrbacteria bacterium GW2011_GWF2_40_263]KKR68088.1 MAG: Lysophospholipase L1 and related esterase [Candidatus Uhrbacteria bacterium GW2011_GWE2_40_58]OGL91789.1 MAG: hypothetical protein A2239_04490 [Candidatus Uhrbacteria bacterium RIFOXYA2_FULL_40_9]OGL97239.1 MAG: hypothetical protein A2332_01465 [Candidatus Uhrbacteria bacterium RIFOXYB2_FULL_41_18]HBK34454.1 hypothetical protein [Candidatus Uhrbacteria bacterium]